jgi:hypothetical protein
MLTCQRDPKGQQFASSCDLIIKSDTLIYVVDALGVWSIEDFDACLYSQL